ncbi:MAG TPA: sialidase family protein [Acidimicrobiales bacterium]|nr:sialidase family protein [Acidimicrobiales bacterium]
MKSTAACRIVLAVMVMGLGLGPPAVAAGPGDGEPEAPEVTAAVQVTPNPRQTRAHSSPQLAVNPTNGELAIVESEVRHDFRCAVHLSVNGGRSWFPGGDLMMEPWTECSRKPINGPYATTVFDSDGVLYVAFYASDPQFADAEDLPLHVFLARSDDGGRTFETNFVHRSPEPVEEDEGLHNNDRPMVAVDPEDHDNVYVSWMQRGAEGEKAAKAMVAASEDGGRNFAEAVDVTDERGGYQARPAVAPDGTLHVIYPIGLDARPENVEPFGVVRTLYHRSSTDHGQTWSERTEVDQGNAGFYGGRKYLLTSDDDGRLYAVWYANPEPEFDPTKEDVDIFLRTSDDGGQTWGDRVTVNDEADQELVNHYDPGIAIAPNGRVDIAWYDFRNSPYPEQFPAEFTAPFNHGGYQDVYYTWSDDGGRTFAPNVRITDRIINREIGVWSNNIHSHMSVGVASTDEGAYFAWQDSRNGDDLNQAEDVYFASALHEPGAAGEGDDGMPGWAVAAIVVTSILAGVGLALLAVSLSARRRSGEAPAAA